MTRISARQRDGSRCFSLIIANGDRIDVQPWLMCFLQNQKTKKTHNQTYNVHMRKVYLQPHSLYGDKGALPLQILLSGTLLPAVSPVCSAPLTSADLAKSPR